MVLWNLNMQFLMGKKMSQKDFEFFTNNLVREVHFSTLWFSCMGPSQHWWWASNCCMNYCVFINLWAWDRLSRFGRNRKGLQWEIFPTKKFPLQLDSKCHVRRGVSALRMVQTRRLRHALNSSHISCIFIPTTTSGDLASTNCTTTNL